MAHAPSPRYRQEFLRRLGTNLYGRALGAFGKILRDPPTLVTDRDWDCLIVLDACRYDALADAWQRQSFPPRELPHVVSPGTTTLLWIRANFVHNPARGRLSDVAVVAGNPYMSRTYFELQGWRYPFQRSVDIWKGGWDETMGTVHPKEVYRAAQSIGGNRALVHFLQPHSPFIPNPDVTWAGIETGEIPLRRAQEAYEANLLLVLKWALRLVEEREGRVVITSDHGELFGEYGLFAHPHKVYVPEMVKVPWVELEGGTRLSLREESP